MSREDAPVNRRGQSQRRMPRRPARPIETSRGADAPLARARRKTFKEAFAEARKELGPGKTFTWRGKKYTTNRADDKPKAAPSKMTAKKASVSKPSVKKPGLQKSSVSVASGVSKSAKSKREDKRADRQGARARKRAIVKSVRGERKDIRTAKKDARKSMTRGDKLRARAQKADARAASRSVKKAPGKPGGNIRTAAALKNVDIKSKDRFMKEGGVVKKYVRRK